MNSVLTVCRVLCLPPRWRLLQHVPAAAEQVGEFIQRAGGGPRPRHVLHGSMSRGRAAELGPALLAREGLGSVGHGGGAAGHAARHHSLVRGRVLEAEGGERAAHADRGRAGRVTAWVAVDQCRRLVQVGGQGRG